MKIRQVEIDNMKLVNDLISAIKAEIEAQEVEAGWVWTPGKILAESPAETVLNFLGQASCAMLNARSAAGDERLIIGGYDDSGPVCP